MKKQFIKPGDSVSMSLGKYHANYICMSIFNKKTITLRRSDTPKTKIDAVRKPEIITITIK